MAAAAAAAGNPCASAGNPRTSADSGAAEPVADADFGPGVSDGFGPGTSDGDDDRDGFGLGTSDRDSFGPDAGTGDGDGDRDGFGPGASDGDGGENALAPRQTTPYSLVMYVSNTQSIKYRNCSFRIVGYYL